MTITAKIYIILLIIFLSSADKTFCSDTYDINYYLQIVNNKDSARSKDLGKYYEETGTLFLQEKKVHEVVQYYQNAAKIYEEKNLHAEAGRLYNLVAYHYPYDKDFPDSVSYYYQKSINNWKIIKNHSQIIYSMIGMTWNYYNNNNFSKAFNQIQIAMELCEKHPEAKNWIEIYKFLAVYYKNIEDYDKENYYLIESLNIALPGFKKWIFKSLVENEISRENYEQAEIYIDSFISSRQDTFSYSISNYYIAQIKQLQAEESESVNYLNKAFAYIKNVDYYFQSLVLDIANLYSILKEYHNTIEVCNYAISRLEENNSDIGIEEMYLLLGETYLELSNYTDAEKNLDLCWQKVNRYEHSEIKHNCSRLLYNLYFATGQEKEALRMANYYIESFADFSSLEQAKHEKQFENQLLVNEYRHQLELQNQKQGLIQIFFIILVCVVSGVGLYFFFSFKRKKMANMLLVEQKAEIERISLELHQADKMKLNFFTNISHELRTPLTLIKSPLKELLANTNNNEELRGVLELMQKNANKLTSIIKQLTELRKLDEGKLKENRVEKEIVHSIKTLASSYESYCRETGCSLSMTANISSASILFDFEKLETVITNLLSNAFKYNKRNGNVNLDINLGDTLLDIRISDTGLGIEKDNQAKIFERYYQVNSNNITVEGSGIGLAFVKEITEFLKGTISVYSEENLGTTIQLIFPVEESEIIDTRSFNFVIQVQEKNETTNIDEVLERFKDKYTLLIVEDNIDLQNYLFGIFSTEYHVLLANNGNEGFHKAVNEIPDLIISDIMMPEKDGIALSGELKKNKVTSHIPLILLTAKDADESMVEGYVQGIDDYIVKPFDAKLLLLKVNNILATLDQLKKQFSFSNYSAEKYMTNTDKRFIDNCIEIINSNIDNSLFTIDTLANETGFSKRNFYRKMESLTGKTPADFVKAYKMRYAAKLLKSKHLRIFEVAVAIGYDDTSSFSKTFKKYMGSLPSDYVKEN